MDDNERFHLLNIQGDGNITKAPGLGRRHLVAFLAFLGCATSYAIRFNFSIALVAMVNYNPSTSSFNYSGPDMCPTHETMVNRTRKGEFDWDAHTQGILLSAFFYGFVTSQILGGQLAERYGGKLIYGMGITMASVVSLLVPMLARTHVGLLIAARVFEGVAEGLCLPAMYVVLSKWSPGSEKTFLGVFALSGDNIGTVIGTAVSGFLAAHAPDGGWPYIFYVFGGIGILLAIAWKLFTSETPSTHPSISEVEKRYILDTTGNREKVTKTPWKAIITSRPFLGLMFGQLTKDWVYYMLLTTLPSYFQQILRFDLTHNGIVSALPFLVMTLVEIPSGLVADTLINRNILTTATVRRIYSGLGLFLPSMILVVQGYMGCDKLTSVIMLCIASAFLGIAFSSVTINYYDLAPIYVGTIFGISNTIGSLAGVIGPNVVEAITEASPFISRWRIVFFVNLTVSIIGGTIHLVLLSGEVESWAKIHVEHEKSPDTAFDRFDEKPNRSHHDDEAESTEK